MSRQATGYGYIFEANGAWNSRFYIRVRGERVQKSLRICTKDGEHAAKDSPSVVQLATDLVKQAQTHAKNQEQTFTTKKCVTCGRYTKAARNAGENQNVR